MTESCRCQVDRCPCAVHAKRRGQGMCIYCGLQPAAAGRVSCLGCRKERAVKLGERRARAEKEGICIQCFAEPAAPKRTSCSGCLSDAAARAEVRRQRLAGRPSATTTFCGGAP